MAGMAALKALLSKSGGEGMDLLKALGAKGGDLGRKGVFALDQKLAKIPGMAAKQDPLAMTDAYADPRKRNALLAGLGLGAGGAGVAAMGGEDEEDEDEGLGKLKALLGL